MEKEIELIVKRYLVKVKKELPNWLKKSNGEYHSIMNELEEHILEKAEALSGSNKLTTESVISAIKHMGSPCNIAEEYKKRGTPFIYITKELWPLYIKMIFSTFLVIILFSLNLVAITITGFGRAPETSDIAEYVLIFPIVFIIITIIFFILSKEGYLPKDINYISKREKKIGKKRKIDILLFSKNDEKSKYKIRRLNLFIIGIIEIIIGILFVIILNDTYPHYYSPLGYFSIFLIIGLIVLCLGFISVIQSILENKYFKINQLFEIISIFLKTIIAFIVFDSEPNINMQIVSIIIVLSTLYNIYCIFKLERLK
ncbi:MAG: hypothetical protein KGD57_04025 [Candidatus Lokiarchaeota archaeon]|nr:hypothetical protein [Candidatus Lokiarchaeota archaeon]